MSLVFSKHMFLITSQQLDCSFLPHMQQQSPSCLSHVHAFSLSPTPSCKTSSFAWMAFLRQKQREKVDRKRSFGRGRRQREMHRWGTDWKEAVVSGQTQKGSLRWSVAGCPGSQLFRDRLDWFLPSQHPFFPALAAHLYQQRGRKKSAR